MENIINNPGLHHLAEEIFWNLNSDDLENCAQINESSNQILENPLFWMEKLVRRGRLSKKNQDEWRKAIQSVKNYEKEKHIVLYFKWALQEDGGFDLHCYTSPMVQDDFQQQIMKISSSLKVSYENIYGNKEIVKILAPLTDNPNAPDKFGRTPIHGAAQYGHTEIFKILAPLTDNPNAPDKFGDTPSKSAMNGKIRSILESFTCATENKDGPSKIP